MATTKMNKRRKPAPAMGPIEPDKLYPLRVFYETTGYGETAVTKMRREAEEMGIKFAVERARKVSVLGGKFIEYMNRIAASNN